MIALVLAASSAVLRSFRLSAKPIWLDESVSWFFAHQSTADLFKLVSSDVHPPLYYLLLKAWIVPFGDSLTGLRSLSVCAGVLATMLAYWLGRLVLPRVTALTVAVVVALSPHSLLYSQEARMYALVTAAVMGALVSYVLWERSGLANRGALVCFVMSSACALYLHYFSVFPIGVIWLHGTAAVRRWRGGSACSRRDWYIAAGALTLVYLPWISVAIAQLHRGQAWRAPVSLGEVPGLMSLYARQFVFGNFRIPELASWQCAITLGPLAGGLILCWRRATASPREGIALLLGTLSLAPLALAFVVMPLSGHLNIGRYVGYAMPLSVLASSYGWFRTSRVAAALANCVLIVVMLPSLRAYYQEPALDDDVRPVIAYISQHDLQRSDADEASVVCAAPGYLQHELEYYAPRSLSIEPIADDADMDRVLLQPGRWIVVDYRWPRFDALLSDRRVRWIQMRGVPSDRLRLFVSPAH